MELQELNEFPDAGPNYVVVVLTSQGFFCPVIHTRLLGVRPLEIWIFGAPATDEEKWIAEAAQPLAAVLSPEKVHRISFLEETTLPSPPVR